ncbi:MAG: glycosyl transferase [Legionellales bacterium]|nr:glycosyl transferase [Legionellales bacterium]|tara:strand:+ start:1294 stop:2157 length:864 start_codon:yes stop_codon:yes gene_type:complete
MTKNISIVIPAKNECAGLKKILPVIQKLYSDLEVIVVDDGSTDATLQVCKDYNVKVISHPYSKGNGAAIKTGARMSEAEIIVFMDADGQHDPEHILKLLIKIDEGYDMVVGARSPSSQANLGRCIANFIYNKFSGFMVNHKIDDLTSGFRAVKATKFKEFMHLYPNGFSYPSTSTMAFFRSGYSVLYIPIEASKRIGSSHIRLIKDGIRFVLILFKIGTLYSPLKIFFPLSVLCFITGLMHYIYTYLSAGRFTNMSMLLFLTSLLIFLIGLVSEQITMLLYQKLKDK